jgi:apolipoprotein N-acyltransferase
MVNLLLFKSIKYWLENKKLKPVLTETILAAILIIVPPVYSSVVYNNFEETENPYEIAVIQPNIDPYEKFNDIPPEEQMDILLHIADSLGTATTDYFVAPETFINNNLWISQAHRNPSIRKLKEFMQKYPDAEFVIGATTYQHYESEDEASPTARPYQEDKFYDSYNSALQIDTSENIPIYHKSQLVVGVEKMPYASALKWLGKLTLKLGGTMRSHGSQENRETLENIHDNTKVGPVICYESIFGEYVTDYVKEADANFLFVITNDGWWADTPGYIQHNSFSSLRAIETRRSIARSANTGISAFFNQRGDILQSLGWWKRGGLSAVLNANDELTFYVKYGDYLGRISVFTGIFMLLYTLVKMILGRAKGRGLRAEG